jgi:hypothetical protein
MFTPIPLFKRTATALALSAAIAIISVPQALAGSGSRYGAPDGWYPYIVSLTKAKMAARYGAPDGWYPYIVSLTQANIAAREHPTLIDGRSPDTKDAALAAQQQALTPTDGRSPDTRDAAILAHTPVVTVDQAPGFHWGDFAIGIAAAFGLTLIVSIGLLAVRHNRKQPTPVATA